MSQRPIYLDDQGNPLPTSDPVYLDDQGNPIAAPKAAPKEPGFIDRMLADNPALPPMLRGGQAVLRTAKANPVTTGSIVGGALAAPFTGGLSALPAIAATGLASGLGAGAGQLASGERPDLATMATEGGTAMLGHGAGAALTAGAKAVARPVAKGVLRMAPRLQKEYDDLIGTFLKERIPVGQSAVARDRMKASAAQARQIAADAEAAGAAPVGPREIVREFGSVRDDVANRAANGRPGADAEMREIVDRAKALRQSGPQSVTRNQELKQSAQTDASTAFRAQDRGAVIKDTTAKLDKAVAVGRQKAAETRIPGIKDTNKRTQNLMGLEEALEGAQEKSGSPLGWNPINWGGAMFPGTSSKAAFLLDSASRAPLPASFRTALLAALAGDQEK